MQLDGNELVVKIDITDAGHLYELLKFIRQRNTQTRSEIGEIYLIFKWYF